MEQNISHSLDHNLSNYDTIQLPSEGKFYPNKLSVVYVTYLNGSDETLFSSPNLISSGGLIDELLKRKIKGGLDINGKEIKNIDSLELLEGDRMAILIYLRAMFEPIYRIYYNEDNSKFYDFDLSKLKIKESKETPNEKGNFKMELPFSKNNIEYKLLTGKDQKELREYSNKNVSDIDESDLMSLIRQIVLVQIGDKEIVDKIQIKRYLQELHLKDYRYITNNININTPSIDLNIEIPSLNGGETVKTFLPITSEFFYPTV